jgi:hypothetical protein
MAGGTMSSKPRKTWREKLADSKDLPKTILVPAPMQVDEAMRRVPKGRLATINELRAYLARKHGTDTACQMTTGIFVWIAAHAAEEARAAGEKDTTPYWRTLKTGGELNPKYPGGIPALKKLLAAEGHKVVQKGKKHLVADYETKLAARSDPGPKPGPIPRLTPGLSPKSTRSRTGRLQSGSHSNGYRGSTRSFTRSRLSVGHRVSQSFGRRFAHRLGRSLAHHSAHRSVSCRLPLKTDPFVPLKSDPPS